mmetsp:Transcript_68075/g.220433  ORF Transcript_68075/g.220433 Transcript_68075/m.220433 type:complete len:97 (-) Transcript_68075:132-422(-)
MCARASGTLRVSAVFVASLVEHRWTLNHLPELVRSSVKQGFYEEEFFDILRDEIRFEGVAGVMLNITVSTNGLPSGYIIYSLFFFFLVMGEPSTPC